MLHCHSNLVSSAGLDGNLDVRRTVVCFQHVIVRHGLLSFWVRFVDRFDVEMLVLHQPASHRARGCRRLSLHQCTIRAMDVSVVKLLLKVVFGLLVLGKNHDSRRLFVKPVHDEAPRLGIGLRTCSTQRLWSVSISSRSVATDKSWGGLLTTNSASSSNRTSRSTEGADFGDGVRVSARCRSRTSIVSPSVSSCLARCTTSPFSTTRPCVSILRRVEPLEFGNIVRNAARSSPAPLCLCFTPSPTTPTRRSTHQPRPIGLVARG